MVAASLLVSCNSGNENGSKKAGAAGLPASACDAMCNRARTELRSFTDWLEKYDQVGYVGEIGIPGREADANWGDLASGWYGDANRAGLWVTTWATGEFWDPGYTLTTYGRTGGMGTPLDATTPQSAVIEDNPTSAGILRGVNVPAGPSPAGSVEDKHPAGFSNETLDSLPDRHIKPESLRYLAGRGVRLVRLPFNWERLQPELNADLATGEVAHLREVIDVAAGLDITVVLDMHNFGGYYQYDAKRRTGVRKVIGTPGLPIATFADSWRRIVTEFGDEENVVWDLMNEPARMKEVDGVPASRIWEQASSAALKAIRSTGDRHIVTVAGYGYSTAAFWSRTHPKPWITDPADKTRYQAHQYWDTALTGEYKRTYAQELETAEAAGYRACTSKGCPAKVKE